MSKVSTSVSPVFRMKMPSSSNKDAPKLAALKNLKIPKSSSNSLPGKILSSKTLSGSAVKAKSPKTKLSSIQSSLRSIISKTKKAKKVAAPPRSAAPEAIPSPAFFGRPNITKR